MSAENGCMEAITEFVQSQFPETAPSESISSNSVLNGESASQQADATAELQRLLAAYPSSCAYLLRCVASSNGLADVGTALQQLQEILLSALSLSDLTLKAVRSDYYAEKQMKVNCLLWFPKLISHHTMLKDDVIFETREA